MQKYDADEARDDDYDDDGNEKKTRSAWSSGDKRNKKHSNKRNCNVCVCCFSSVASYFFLSYAKSTLCYHSFRWSVDSVVH